MDAKETAAAPPGATGQSSFDEFFNGVNLPDAPATDLTNKMKSFVLDHEAALKEMYKVLGEEVGDSWDAEHDPIGIDVTPLDQEGILSMVTKFEDNSQFNKIVMVFSYLCEEIRELVDLAETRYYGVLAMFGHRDDDGEGGDGSAEMKRKNQAEGKGAPPPIDIEPEMEMGQFLPFFQDLVNYINRAEAVMQNVVCQLACLYHPRQKLHMTTFKDVRLLPLFERLGSLCRALITFDAIISDNPNIGEGWHQYKRMIKYVRSDPKGYGVDEAQLRLFEGLLVRLDRKVLNATIFEDAISQEFDGAVSSASIISGNKVLYKEFTDAILSIIKKIGASLGADVETYPRTHVVDVFGLYALYRRVFASMGKPDKRMFKNLWEMQLKMPIVLLHGRAMWFPNLFLQNHAPLKTSGLNPAPNQIAKKQKEYLRKLDEDFRRKSEEIYMHVMLWMVRMESRQTLQNSGGVRGMDSLLNARGKLLINGLLLGNQIRNILTTSIAMHLALKVPILPKNVRALAILAEMLKAIEATYHRASQMVAENIAHLIGQTLFQLKRLIGPVRLSLTNKPQRRMTPGKTDVLSALNLAIDCLDGTPTYERRTVIEVSLCIAQLRKTMRSAAFDDVQYQLWKLDLLSSYQEKLKRACSCDCLYWIADVIPVFFEDIFRNPDQVTRIPYLLAALRDCQELLLSYDPTPPSQIIQKMQKGEPHPPTQLAKRFLDGFKNEVLGHFEKKIIKPLCREVENDLRLHIHSVVLQQSSLRKVKFKDLRKFFEMRPLKFFDVMIDVKEKVTHYLDMTFYNLTTVTLHDWRIYAEMRNLAYEEYGLKMAEVHLPGSSHYSEGLDILEIMRNIHIFVARYNYNMNTQMFVQQATDQKHLNTISIQHIADSIRTHGTGVMNTTINFTYHFLGRKFMLFSEFLFDDHIKSRLMKDIRWFKDNNEKLKNKYPFVRAEKFNRAIRKLGVNKKGETYLDKFRRTITEIGNALGYVRTVRSAGMAYSSNAIKFVPDLEDIVDFAELVDEQKLSTETRESCANLDAVLKSLTDSFGGNTEFLKVLVNVIKPALKKKRDKFRHLDNFHIIVPPLTFNFVEKMSIQKERISKKSGRGEASFTDDGFALGLAYLLKLLDQDTAFDSLHWFNAVKDFVNEKKAEIAAQKKNRSRSNSTDMQHVQLTLKRLHNIRREFELLYYSFTGARIFFSEQEKSNKDKEEKEEGKDEKKDGEDAKETSAAPAGSDPSVPASPAAGVPPPPGAPAAPVAGVPPPPGALGGEDQLPAIPPPPSGLLPPPPM